MYKCIKCNKEFKYESQFSRHKNRKNPCNKKKEYNCNVCNVQFKCPYDKLRHEKTKKHILKVSIQGNKNQIDKSGIDVQTNKYQIIINKLNNEINKLENINNNLNNNITILEKEKLQLNNEISNLTNKINILNKSNQLLKNNQKIHNIKEYIYIIHSAQHINENIYKIGRTKNISKRLKQYPNGSELLFTTTCNNSKLIENKIIHYLKNDSNYIHYKESGNEYFKCELENLKFDIQNIINK